VHLDKLDWDRPVLVCEPQQARGIPRNLQLDETPVGVPWGQWAICRALFVSEVGSGDSAFTGAGSMVPAMGTVKSIAAARKAVREASAERNKNARAAQRSKSRSRRHLPRHDASSARAKLRGD
jgi:hypothetical protein